MSDTQLTAFEEVNVGDFIRFTDRDKSGKFSYVGEVMTVTKAKKKEPAFFEMLTFDGLMGFVFDEKNGFESDLTKTNSKPKGWAKFKKDPKAFAAANAPPPVLPKKTKKEQVMELVAANPRK